MGKHYKHLNRNDRPVIERMCFAMRKPSEIAEAVGCCLKTVYNELKRDKYMHTNSDLTEEVRYSPDKAQAKYEAHLKSKGAGLKIGNDIALADFLEDKIVNEKYLPQAALYAIKNEGLRFSVQIKSVNTIYSYIRKGVFLNLSMKHLPRKEKKRKQNVKRAKKDSQGTSIEKKPKEISEREIFGHWEMDCVVGKNNNKKTLLVLTE